MAQVCFCSVMFDIILGHLLGSNSNGLCCYQVLFSQDGGLPDALDRYPKP